MKAWRKPSYKNTIKMFAHTDPTTGQVRVPSARQVKLAIEMTPRVKIPSVLFSSLMRRFYNMENQENATK